MAHIMFAADAGALGQLKPYEEALEQFEGHFALTTSNPDELIESMVRRSVDLVVAQGPMELGSLTMEETACGWATGYVAIRKAREQGSNVPVIFLTTVFDPPGLEGMEVLEMPLSLEIFCKTVQNLLQD